MKQEPEQQRNAMAQSEERASTDQQMQQGMPATASLSQYHSNNNSHKMNNWQIESQLRTRQVREENQAKRFSLLDPEIFVPAAGSRLHSSPSFSHKKAPSPWKSVAASTATPPNNGSMTGSRVPLDDSRSRSSSSVAGYAIRGGGGLGDKTLTPSYTNPAPHTVLPPTSSSFSPYPSFTRNENKSDDFVTVAAASSSSVPCLLPPMASMCVSPASMDGSTLSNPGSNDSNNFSNYTNYFYQTLKHSNPYQNLPESILL